MSDLSGALLTALINQGQWLLAAVLFLAALGVPLPATMLLLARRRLCPSGCARTRDVGRDRCGRRGGGGTWAAISQAG